MDRICTLVRDIKRPNVCYAYFLSVFQLLQSVMVACPSEGVCERVCKFYKIIIRNGGDALKPSLHSLSVVCSTSFQSVPFSCFLYVVSIIIDQYATDASNHDFLIALYDNMSGLFFQRFDKLLFRCVIS